MQTQVGKQVLSGNTSIIGIYFPEKPYKIKTGEKAGRFIDVLMFENPRYLFSLKRYLDEKLKDNPSASNGLYQHMRWLIAKSDLRVPKLMCPFCGKETGKQALFVQGTNGKYSSREEVVSCASSQCTEKLKDCGLLNYSLRKREIVPLKFSAIAELPLDLAETSEFLCKAFGIEELTPETAFEFFRK